MFGEKSSKALESIFVLCFMHFGGKKISGLGVCAFLLVSCFEYGVAISVLVSRFELFGMVCVCASLNRVIWMK